MKIFVTKNGQRLGPFTPDEIRRQLQAGTLKLTDWAWYEGQPDWMAIHQLPGFNFAGATQHPANVPPSPPTPELQRPIVVWVFSLVLFLYIPLTTLSMFFTLGQAFFIIVNSGNSVPHFLSIFPFFSVALTLLVKTLDLAGAICLFLLRRAALYLFSIALAISVLNLLYLFLFKHWPPPYSSNSYLYVKTVGSAASALLMYAIVISYTGYLYFNKTLR